MITLPSLRDYQTRIINEARTKVMEIKGRRRVDDKRGVGVLIQMPTGAGKTLTALHLIQKALSEQRRVLWLAAKEELVYQPVDALYKYGFASRIITRGEQRGHLGSYLTVGTIQSLLRWENPPPADLVIFDEARHYVASQWGKLAGAYHQSIRIGLDATPARADGSPLGDLFDALIPGPAVADLVHWGFLVPSVVFAPNKQQDDWAETPVEAYRRLAPNRRTILYAPSVHEAKRQAMLFEQAGFKALAVDGTTKTTQRAQALGLLATGGIDVLCNCNLFVEGLDVPSVECAIIARGVSAESTWIQIGGRTLRPSPGTGKERATIIDLHGHVHKHGPLDVARTFHLDGLPIRRPANLPAAVQCKGCLGWGSGSVCNHCGFALPPPPPPKITRAELVEQKLAKQDALAKSGPKWEFWCELVRSAQTKGWKPAAAFLRFKDKYGHPPPWRQDQVPMEVR